MKYTQIIFSLFLLFINQPFFNQTTKAFNKENINLNNLSSDEISSYYGDFLNKFGDDLISYLYDVISKDNTFVTYTKAGDWYKVTDRNYLISNEINPIDYDFDQDNISTYYTYNMYMSKSSNNDINKAISNAVNSAKVKKGSNKVEYTYDSELNKYIITKPNNYIGVDREHVWPKNKGFKVVNNSGNDVFEKGAPTDLHNLVAADHNTNSVGHNDYIYGNVNNKEGNEVYAYFADNTSEISGWKETINGITIFEPTDEWKGNIARCLFYMATRYSKKLDNNTQGQPYLELTNDLTKESNNETFIGYHPNLNILLKWNEIDPVDEQEIKRNNLIYNNVQNNRNPYIDYPNLAIRAFSTNYDFSLLKDNYKLHLSSNRTLDIVLPSSDDQYQLKEVNYDNNIIELKDYKTIVPKNIGSTNITYILENINNNEIKEFKTNVEIKDDVKTTLPSNISIKQFQTTTLSYEVNNLFDTDKISLISNNNKVLIEDNRYVKARSLGQSEIKLIVNCDDIEIEVATCIVEVTFNYIFLIIIISVVLVVIIILIIILLVNKKKTKIKKKN